MWHRMDMAAARPSRFLPPLACVCAAWLLAVGPARAQAAADASAPAASAPVASSSPAQAAPMPGDASAGAADASATASAYDPTAPSTDDRLRAATSAGVIAFVGLTLGGVGIPGALGVVASAVGGLLPQEALYIAAVIGGASGAAAGGIIGAFPLTHWYGWPVVGVGAALGSCIGLVPTALFAWAQTQDPPDPFDALNPLVLGQSASLVVAMAGAAGGAAVAAAFFAEKREVEAQ